MLNTFKFQYDNTLSFIWSGFNYYLKNLNSNMIIL